LLGRASAEKPQGHTLGSRAASAGDLPAHRAGKRMAAALPVVPRQRHGRSPRLRLRPMATETFVSRATTSNGWRGIPPDATYLFKHALLQDLAHGALLREPRRVLHMRIAQALEAHFPDVAQSQPQVLARHCAEAGLFEKAAALWRSAGRKSMERSAVVEAEFQFAQALAQIAELPSSAALRREQIRLQAGLISAMMFSRGYTSATTKAALRQAQAIIDRSETLGEPMDDPQPLYILLEG